MEDINFECLSLNTQPFVVKENGVFANKNIERGDYICCYPIDAIFFNKPIER